MRLLASLAFAGFGVGLLPASAAPSTLAGGDWRRVPIEGIPADRSVWPAVGGACPSAAERAVAQIDP